MHSQGNESGRYRPGSDSRQKQHSTDFVERSVMVSRAEKYVLLLAIPIVQQLDWETANPVDEIHTASSVV